MRSVVLQFWVSVDGYSCDPGTELFAVLDALEDPEQEKYVAGRLRQAGTHIMGRGAYEEMAGFWPTSAGPLAAPMNEIPKVVFSRTLTAADWPVSRIASGDTAHEIAALRAEPSAEILAHGGTRFARSLIELGLVDQYRLWVLPAAAGRGEPLFTGLTRLRLVSSTAFSSGMLELVYAPATPDTTQG
jgi:dihydrofolate reductase